MNHNLAEQRGTILNSWSNITLTVARPLLVLCHVTSRKKTSPCLLEKLETFELSNCFASYRLLTIEVSRFLEKG